MRSGRNKPKAPEAPKPKKGLRLSEETYRLLFEKNPHPMWVHEEKECRFLAVNEAAIKHYGYSREEFLSMTLFDIRPEVEIPRLRTFVKHQQTEPGPYVHSAGIWRHRKKNGTLIDMEITTSRVLFMGRKVVLVHADDITDRLCSEKALRESEARLRDSEARFRSAFRNAPVGMALLSLDGEILQVNPSMCEMLGYTEGEILKMRMHEVTYPDDVAGSWEVMRRVIRGESTSFETEKRYIHKSGRLIWALLRGTVIRDREGRPLYYLGHVQDITRRKQVEAEREQLFQELERSRNNLQQLSRRLVQIQEAERRRIALELHDQVGQELTALKLSLERCQEFNPAGPNTVFEETHARASRLLTMVRDLSLDLRPTMLDDLGLLDALLWYFDRFKASSGLRIDFKHRDLGHRRFAPEIETAAFRIVQEALTNVTRHSQARSVRIWLWASKERLMLSIEDQGVGFDAEAVLRAGTSTGLSGMRERAALLGGHLSIDSVVGRGTSLTAELPLQDKPGEQVAP